MRDNQSLEIGELMGGFRLGGGGGVKFEKNGPDLTNHGWECLADSETVRHMVLLTGAGNATTF